ncbi:MAG: TlpA family protein disulfide reductase [bacterium]
MGVVLELASEKDVRLLQKEPLKQLRVVHFWATWCAPCLEEFPQLLSLGSRFPEVELVAVSLDSVEDKSEVVAFLASQKSSCRNLLFKGQNAQGILKAFDRQWKELLPYTVVIDLRGKIAYRREGQLDLQEVRSVIEKLIHAENGKERRGSRNSEVVCKAWTGRGRVRDSNQRGHHILPPVSLARRFG